MPQLPIKPSDFRRGQSEISASVLNQIIAMVLRQIRGGQSTNVGYYGDRVTINSDQVVVPHVDVQDYVAQFVVLGEEDDCLVCTPFYQPVQGNLDPMPGQYAPQVYDPTLGTSSVVRVRIAKPYELQRSPWDGQTVGSVIDFSGQPVGQRLYGGVQQNISPAYLPGDIIFATRSVSGYQEPQQYDDYTDSYSGSYGGSYSGTGQKPVPIAWNDVNTAARKWEFSSGIEPIVDVSASIRGLVNLLDQKLGQGTKYTDVLGLPEDLISDPPFANVCVVNSTRSSGETAPFASDNILTIDTHTTDASDTTVGSPRSFLRARSYEAYETLAGYGIMAGTNTVSSPYWVLTIYDTDAHLSYCQAGLTYTDWTIPGEGEGSSNTDEGQYPILSLFFAGTMTADGTALVDRPLGGLIQFGTIPSGGADGGVLGLGAAGFTNLEGLIGYTGGGSYPDPIGTLGDGSVPQAPFFSINLSLIGVGAYGETWGVGQYFTDGSGVLYMGGIAVAGKTHINRDAWIGSGFPTDCLPGTLMVAGNADGTDPTFPALWWDWLPPGTNGQFLKVDTTALHVSNRVGLKWATITWATISSTPTTITGYGITDLMTGSYYTASTPSDFAGGSPPTTQQAFNDRAAAALNALGHPM